MSEILIETEGNIPGKNEAEMLVENTSFLANFASTHNNAFFSGEGFFYTIVPGTDARKWLLDIIDSIIQQGYVIENLQSDRIEQFLRNPIFLAWEDDKIRLGKGVQKMDGDTVKKYSEQIIRDISGIIYEYKPGRTFVGSCDLFLSILWYNNVRTGIQTEEVANILIENGKITKKFLVAKRIDPVPSKDADIKPMTQILRSRKIKTLSESGNADLHEYECTFPEVTEKEWVGYKLIKKDPMVDGEEGVETNGTIIPVKPPTDKDLSILVGTGVHIIKEGDTEYIIADRFGFIYFDPKTKQVSIADEINNTDPIGPKTGNIEVVAEIFKQHTHIEHGYRLTGNTIKMLGGLMSGNIISNSGDISIAWTVTDGGRVTALAGDISVVGKILGGKIEAFAGKITASYAENSVLIAHEIEIDQAIHCTLIADIITIKTSSGSSFFGKNIHIHTVDFTGDFEHDIKGIIYVHDNLIARKTVKIIGNIQKDIISLTGEIHQVHKELSESDFEATKTRIIAKKKWNIPYDEHEKMLIEKYTLYTNLRKRKEEQEVALVWLVAENPDIESILQNLEADNSANTGLSIDTISYSPKTKKEIQEKKSKNIPAIFFDLGIEFYSAHDIPCYLKEMALWPKAGKNYFVDMANRLTLSMTRNDARIHPFHSEKSSEWTICLSYAEMDEYIQTRRMWVRESPSKDINEVVPRSENRVTVSSVELIHAIRKDPEVVRRTFCVAVDIDGRYRAFVQDFSGSGVSLILDIHQKYIPVFEKFEEIDLEFEINKVVHKQSLIITSVVEIEDKILRIGGYYINLSEDISNSLYRSKNFLELALRTQTEKL